MAKDYKGCNRRASLVVEDQQATATTQQIVDQKLQHFREAILVNCRLASLKTKNMIKLVWVASDGFFRWFWRRPADHTMVCQQGFTVFAFQIIVGENFLARNQKLDICANLGYFLVSP